MYGFDERFLKQVLLPYYAKQGLVLSFVQDEATRLYEVLLDCRSVQNIHSENLFLLI
jgi:hypothetical protein